MKLNLGCGADLKRDYLNIDIKAPENLPRGFQFKQGDCGDLFFISDGKVEEIYAKYLLEHIHTLNLKEYLFEWRRVLKYNGKLVVVFPDFDKIIEQYQKCKKLETIEDFMNFLGLSYHLLNPTQKNLVKSDQHRSIVTKKLFEIFLESEGFKLVKVSNYGTNEEQKYLTLIEAVKVRKD